MEYKMDKKEVASRLQEVLNRNIDRKVNNLIPEDIRQLNICIAALTIPVVSKSFYCLEGGIKGSEHVCKKQCDSCNRFQQ